MAGLGIGPFQHLATAQALEKQPDVADGLSSRAVLDASRSLSTASTDTAGMELLTASRGQSLCGPDDITEEEELLSRELTREILLEGYGLLGCDPPHPSASRRSSRGASRHTSTEPLCDQFSGLMACREAKEEPDPPLYEQVGGGVVMKVRTGGEVQGMLACGRRRAARLTHAADLLLGVGPIGDAPRARRAWSPSHTLCTLCHAVACCRPHPPRPVARFPPQPTPRRRGPRRAAHR